MPLGNTRKNKVQQSSSRPKGYQRSGVLKKCFRLGREESISATKRKPEGSKPSFVAAVVSPKAILFNTLSLKPLVYSKSEIPHLACSLWCPFAFVLDLTPCYFHKTSFVCSLSPSLPPRILYRSFISRQNEFTERGNCVRPSVRLYRNTHYVWVWGGVCMVGRLEQNCRNDDVTKKMIFASLLKRSVCF